MSQRQQYLAALHEAARHVAAHILAPDFIRRHPELRDGDESDAPELLAERSSPAHVRVEVISRFAGLAAVFLGARARARTEIAELALARSLLRDLGEEEREAVYRQEAEGIVRAHFLTIRALALQLLHAGRLDAEEAGLIVEVAEGQAPLRVLEAYRAARAGRRTPPQG